MSGPADTVRPSGPVSISDISFGDTTVAEAARLAAGHGCSAVGLWSASLGPTSATSAARLLASHGLGVSNLVADGNTIYPTTLSPLPADPAERVRELLAEMERLAPLVPDAFVVLTGVPPPGVAAAERGAVLRSSLSRLGRRAAELGTRLAVEPIHPSCAADWSTITSFEEAAVMVGGLDGDVGVLVDTWHLADDWPDAATAETMLRTHLDLIAGVQVADWRDPSRGWADRAFPGEGRGGSVLAAATRAAGYTGCLDVEIFSDDGRFGTVLPDSLWALPHHEIARRSVAAFDLTPPAAPSR